MSTKEQKREYIKFLLKNLFGCEMLENSEYQTLEEFCKEYKER